MHVYRPCGSLRRAFGLIWTGASLSEGPPPAITGKFELPSPPLFQHKGSKNEVGLRISEDFEPPLSCLLVCDEINEYACVGKVIVDETCAA